MDFLANNIGKKAAHKILAKFATVASLA